MNRRHPQAPRLSVRQVELFEQPFRLRLPFRFGVITVTEGVQAIARVRIRLEDGREATGEAAEALGAKWFDKDPRLTDAQNLDQLRCAVALCRDAYLAAPAATAFDLHADHYAGLLAAGARLELPPLVCGYGPALLDRAILDALLRLAGVGFWDGLRANLPGLRPHPFAADLDGVDFDAFLRSLVPLRRVAVRHTVGLVDPIVATDQPVGTRVGDGLPETLEEVVATYRNRHFKLKLGGQVDADLDRLGRIAGVLDRIAGPIVVTLDGNEQFDDAEAIAALWRRMSAQPALARLCAATAFIEQPIRRQAALARSVAPLAQYRPVIIDESDGDMDAFVRARALGYRGVSTKLCKGLYKSLANLARCRLWNAAGGADGDAMAGTATGAAGGYFMSAEDLTTQAGVSVQQDLALVALLGIAHVERNAHHFIDGFGERPVAESLAFLQAHPDLYHRHDGRVRLHIVDGALALDSLQCPGFATGVAMDLGATPAMPPARWPASPQGPAR